MPPEPAETMTLRLPRLLLAALLLALPAIALAWGKPAHRVVAQLAEAQLRPAARAEAIRLLAGEAEPGLAGVADWADELRKGGGPGAARTAHWHYVDFHGGGCDYLPARDCPDGDCVVAAIDTQFQRLADRRLADAGRAEALKFLVHLVADEHQPLHASPVPDRGAQDFQVWWHGKGRNLHGVWDALIFDRALQVGHLDEAGYVRMLQAQAPLPPEPAWRPGRSAAQWAEQSCRLVQDGALYPPSHKLGDDYLDAHRAQAERQLRLAGARLAGVLNFALDPPRKAAQP
jgi:hypothetical protein